MWRAVVAEKKMQEEGNSIMIKQLEYQCTILFFFPLKLTLESIKWKSNPSRWSWKMLHFSLLISLDESASSCYADVEATQVSVLAGQPHVGCRIPLVARHCPQTALLQWHCPRSELSPSLPEGSVRTLAPAFIPSIHWLLELLQAISMNLLP